MKIAIATDDFLTVTGHIGRCNGFILYQIEESKIINREQIDNIFTNHRQGGMNQHHHSENEHVHNHSHLLEGLKGCSHLICTAAGWRVVEDLKQNNIEIIFTNEIDADTVAQKFIDGKLEVNNEGVCRSH